MRLSVAAFVLAACISLDARADIFQGEGNCQGWHAGEMAKVMHAYKVWCYDGASSLPTNEQIRDLNIDVISLSAGYGRTDDVYIYADRDYDAFIYRTHIPVLASAGNEGPGALVYSPCSALNVICMGSTRDDSSSGDPLIGVSKPDIAFDTGSTSEAAAHAAVLVEALLQKHPKYRRESALVKAFMLAAASDTGDYERDGAGAVAALEGRGVSVRGDGSNASWTDQDLPVEIDRGGSHRAAISWLQRPGYLRKYERLGNAFSLVVLAPNGTEVARADSIANPHQVVSFDAKETGPYRFKIARIRNADTACDISLGLRVQRMS